MSQVFRIFIAFFCVLFASGQVYASGQFSKSLSVSSLYDDNMLKNDLESGLYDDVQSSDVSTTLRADLGYRLKVSKQDVAFSISISDIQYSNRTELNNIASNSGVKWVYAVNSKLKTSVGLSKKKSLRSFEDVEGVSNNELTTDLLKVNLSYRANQKLSFSGEFSRNHQSNSRLLFEYLDKEVLATGLSVSYKFKPNLSLSITHNDTRSEPIRSSSTALSYGLNSTGLGIGWEYSSKTSLGLNASSNSSSNDSESFNYKLTLKHKLSPKLNFDISGFQTTSEALNETSVLSEVAGLTFSSSYQATGKLRYTFGYSFSSRVSDALLITNVSSYEEQVYRYSLAMAYSFNRITALKATLAHRKRDSERLLSDYVSNSAQINFIFKF